MGEVIEENALGSHIRYRHTISVGIVVERGQSLDHRGSSHRHRRAAHASPRTSSGRARATIATRRAIRRSGKAWRTTKAASCIRRHWPDDLDYKGKNVVVIGSGATAATLIPAIAEECAHVTMLQRSPTFFLTGRNAIEIAEELRELQIDEAWIHEVVRRKILYDQAVFTQRSFSEPDKSRTSCSAAVSAILGPDYDMDTHFTPSYRPWRQRIAFVPDGDLFTASRSGKASVVTDEIDRFTEKGHPAEVGQDARSRYHRHRHRFQSQRARRYRLHDRRQAARV